MAKSTRSRGDRRVRETAATRYEASPPALTGVLLDSDVVIEVLRGRRQVIEQLRALEASPIPSFCCAITWAEVWAGSRPGEAHVTEAFFEARGDVILDATVGRRAGSYLARFGRSHGVELADALIAAAASTSGLSLWTRNRRHYPMEDVEFYEP